MRFAVSLEVVEEMQVKSILNFAWGPMNPTGGSLNLYIQVHTNLHKETSKPLKPRIRALLCVTNYREIYVIEAQLKKFTG